MKAILRWLWPVLFLSPAAAQVSVNTSLVTGQMSGNLAQIYRTAYLHFQLVNCGENIPAVTGQPNLIVQDSFDIHPSAPGNAINGQLWGTDQINCGNVVSSYYVVTAMKDASHPLRDGIPYVICSANSTLTTCGNSSSLGAFDPSTADPMSQTPPVPGFTILYGNPRQTQTWTQPSNTEADFFGAFLFENGLFSGPVLFAQLSALTKANFVYVSDATFGSNPCTGGGTGAFAFYVSGAWTCSLGGNSGPGGGVSSVNPTTNQITVTGPTATPQIGLANNTILPGNASSTGNFNVGGIFTVAGASVNFFGKTMTGIGGTSGIFATAGTITGLAYLCSTGTNGDVTTQGCPVLIPSASGIGSEMQFRNSLTGLMASDSTVFHNPTTHTTTFQNMVINGQMSFFQPYQMASTIPGSALSTGSVGSSGININTDGFFCMWVNGGACNDLSTTGGAAIVPFPVGAQTIVQPTGTIFATNDLNNISYPISVDNWSQPPTSPATLTAGSRTITLTSCPRGLWANAPQAAYAYVYLSTVGTPEAAPITATTCPQVGSASSGTITVTVANSHGAGYTVGSASQGLQEAIFAAPYTVNYYAGGVVEHGTIVVPPQQYTIQGTVFIPTPNMKVDFAGSYMTCNMAASCFVIGSIAQPTFAWDITIENLTAQPGCNNCNFPLIEDSAQHTSMIGIKAANPNPLGTKTSGFSFGSLIQVDNDQAAVIDRLSAYSARWSHCDTSFCSVAVKGPGGVSNAGIMWIKNSNLNMGCAANGIDNQNQNTMRVSDSVVQSPAQFAIRALGKYTNVPNIAVDNVYFEVAGCAGTNPLGIGTAGLIVESGFASVSNSTGPVGAAPLYVNTGTTGATQYNYYIVVHTSSSGGLVSPPLLAGIALTNGSAGNITVKWPQIGTSGTITYDVIRTSGAANTPAPYTAVCTGTTTTACGSVALALTTGAACSTVGTAHICSFTDAVTTNTTSYTVVSPPTYAPALGDGSGAGVFWPGSVILTSGADSIGTSPNISGVTFDRFGDNVANNSTNPVSQMVSSEGELLPLIFSQDCYNILGGMWASCLQNTNGTVSQGATLLQEGEYNAPQPAGQKGRLIFEEGLYGQIAGGHKITLVDSNPAKTLATAGLRPTYDANDTYIGLDNAGNGAASIAQLAFGAPVSISEYIGNVGDNTSWLERLTASLKSFAVPITTTSQITSTLATGTPPFVIASQSRVSNLTTGGNPLAESCGTSTTCAKSPLINWFIVRGIVQLSGGTAAYTALPFANSTWACTTSDIDTATNGSNMVSTGNTTATVTGTGSDHISFICM